MNWFGYEAQNCRKPNGFQSIATKLPDEFILSGRDAKTASICRVKPLNRANSPLFAHFLAAHRRLPRHCSRFHEGMT